MDMTLILTRVLEVCIGLIAIVNFRWQSKGGNRMSEKEWVEQLEAKEREIERWKIKYHTLHMRYEHQTKEHLPRS